MRYQVPFLKSLVWRDLGLNPGLPEHLLTIAGERRGFLHFSRALVQKYMQLLKRSSNSFTSRSQFNSFAITPPLHNTYIMEILSSCNNFSTILWLHYMYLNKPVRENARSELVKEALCRLQQILERILDNTAAVRSSTSNLTNHQVRRTRHTGYCWEGPQDSHLSINSFT